MIRYNKDKRNKKKKRNYITINNKVLQVLKNYLIKIRNGLKDMKNINYIIINNWIIWVLINCLVSKNNYKIKKQLYKNGLIDNKDIQKKGNYINTKKIVQQV